MSGLQGPITDQQVRVLRWIADGCPPDVMTGHSYKTTAIALQSRRLAVITRKAGGWQARVTEAGTHYLQQGTYPDRHWRTPTGRRASRRRPPDPPAGEPADSAGESDQVPPGPDAPTDPSPTDPVPPGPDVPRSPVPAVVPAGPVRHPSADLIDEVLDARGVLRIDPARDRAEIERWIAWSHSAPNLPPGLRLRRRWAGWPDEVLEVCLEDDFWQLTPEEPVPVPARVTTYHPVVAAYRDDPDRHDVSRAQLGRASRILQALVTEAERRGIGVTGVTTIRDASPARDLLRAGQVRFTDGREVVDLRIREEGAPHTARLYTLPRGRVLPDWQRARHTVFAPTGRLRITLDQGIAHDRRPAEFGDSRTRPLEERLPVVLREIQARARESAYRDRERQVRAEAEERQAERDVAVATALFEQAHRGRVLTRQVEQWRAAADLDAYLTTLTALVDALPDPGEQERGRAWLDWARREQARRDPLRLPIAMPDPPVPTEADLASYLPGAGARPGSGRRRRR